MEYNAKKCSSNKHQNIDAIFYCKECKKYICNKCQTFHSDFFESHILINLAKDDPDNFFLDICQEEEHPYKLDFYCKNHNILCCAACCTKIEYKIYGKHKDCVICSLNDIKDDKKNNLKENINILEDLSKTFEKNFNELKDLYEKINSNKDELKIKIQNIFTKIRSSLNEKEDKLLLEVDEKFSELYPNNENVIKNYEKLPNKIKISLEKSKKLDNNWNENNITLMINECINIENNISELNKVKKNLENFHSNLEKEIIFNYEENKTAHILEEIKKLGNIIIKDNNIYKNFNIQLKNPKIVLNNHTKWIYCLLIMNDGRLASASGDHSIIIYNKDTYKPDIIINEHSYYVTCLIQLSSGILASCSGDKTIKLFDIKDNNYKISQILNYHTDQVLKIKELNNKFLVSCSGDKSIIFYKNDNKEYKQDFKIQTSGSCYNIIQTKENEICYSLNGKNIFFYDFIEKKLNATINNINKSNNCYREWFVIVNKNLLLIPGVNNISIININEYALIKEVKYPESGYIYGICLLNDHMILTGTSSGKITQWKIENDNLILFSEKDGACKGNINYILNMANGHIATGSDDYLIKIW